MNACIQFFAAILIIISYNPATTDAAIHLYIHVSKSYHIIYVALGGHPGVLGCPCLAFWGFLQLISC